MADEKIILDLMDLRPRTVAGATLPSALSIQNINGILFQVDDEGNQTAILGGVIGGITQLTGDVTATGPGVVTATIGAKKITYAKIQDVSDGVLLGNVSGSAASVQELSAASVRSFLALAAVATTGSASDLTSGTLAAARMANVGPGAGTIGGGGAVISSLTLDAQGRTTAASVLSVTAGQVLYGGASNAVTQSAGMSYVDTAGARRFTLTGDAGAGATPNGLVFNAINPPGTSYHPGNVDRQVDGSSMFLESLSVSSATFVALSANFNATNFPGVTRAQYTIGASFTGARSGFAIDLLGNDIGLGDGAGLATGATLGFAWLPIIGGTPIGTPASTVLSSGIGFRSPMAVDNTDRGAGDRGRLDFYINGAWHYVRLDDGTLGGSGTVTSVAAGASGLIAIGGTPTVTPTVDLAAIAAHTFIANNTAGSAVPTAVNAAGAWNILGVQPAANFPALTGAVTTTAGSLATTLAASAVGTSNIAANAVTFAKMQTIADQEIVGNVSGGTAVPSGLTKAQVLTFLSIPETTGRIPFGSGTDLTSSANLNFVSGTPQLNAPHILPVATTTYDLGGPAFTWNGLYVTTVNSSTVISGTIEGGAGATLTLQNAASPATAVTLASSGISTTGTIFPTVTATDDLGSSSKLYNHVWAANYNGAVQWNGFVGATPISFTDNAGAALMQFASGAVTFNGTAWGVFGTNAAQQTGGAATAGGTYTATEQSMLQKAYDALRTFGFLN